MSYEMPVSEINARARSAQLAVGVDPDQCISLEETPGGNRTPLDVYSIGLSELRYRVPKLHAPNVGATWREHDYALHVRRIGALHPRIAALVQLSATTCRQMLTRGERNAAENMARRIDFVLANQPFVWEQALRFLIAKSGVITTNVDSRGKLLNDIISVQSSHINQLSEVEPFFEPLDIGSYRV